MSQGDYSLESFYACDLLARASRSGHVSSLDMLKSLYFTHFCRNPFKYTDDVSCSANSVNEEGTMWERNVHFVREPAALL